MRKEKLTHDMLLDAKYVKEDALSELYDLLERIVAPDLLPRMNQILKNLEYELCQCDVSERYTEKNG